MTTSRALSRSREAIERIAGARLDEQGFIHETIIQLRRAVGFDSWGWDWTDPLSTLPVSWQASRMAGSPLPEGTQEEYFKLETGSGDAGHALEPARQRHPVWWLSSGRGRSPEHIHRTGELLRPHGVSDFLTASLTLRGEPWGGLVLTRSDAGPPFSAADAAFLAPLLRLWAQRRRSEVLAALTATSMEPDQARSGILILDPGRRLVASTADAGLLLGALPRPPIGAVLAWLAIHPGHAATPQVPVRDSAGRWVMIRAQRLEGKVSPGTVAVSLATAQPRQLAPLTMAAAGLTAREREVTALVLAGQPTAQIAAELHLTGYTVQDHLKSIFAKLGVRERRQLVTRLLHAPAT